MGLGSFPVATKSHASAHTGAQAPDTLGNSCFEVNFLASQPVLLQFYFKALTVDEKPECSNNEHPLECLRL